MRSLLISLVAICESRAAEEGKCVVGFGGVLGAGDRDSETTILDFLCVDRSISDPK